MGLIYPLEELPMETIQRLIRLITNCSTVQDVDHFFDKTRKQYIKIQKRMIEQQKESERIITEATKAKVSQEHVQRQAEKRIAKINDILED